MTKAQLAEMLGIQDFEFCEICDNVTPFEYVEEFEEDVCTYCYTAGYYELI
jgi:hypothetical protein